MKFAKVDKGELRKGCDHLLGRILRHAACAQSLLDADAEQLEGAFLFVLLGFEELGKLIQLIEAAQVAEATQSEVAEVAGFLSHAHKARQSAVNIALAFDLFIPPLRDAGLDTGSMDEYVAHLSAIETDFERLREGMMYVDFDGGTWVLETAPPRNLIYMDINVLYLASTVIWTDLQKATDFRSFADEMNKSVKQFKGELPRLVRELMKEAAKLAAKQEQDHQ